MALSALKVRTLPAATAAVSLFAMLIAWGWSSATFAQARMYQTDWFFGLMQGLWLPVVRFLIAFLLLIAPSVRSDMADRIAAHWLVAIQTLRICAIGTLLKTLQSGFPLEVEPGISLTGLAFGFSAIWVFFLSKRKSISTDALVIWHLVGVLIIILPDHGIMQSGLPGPFQVYIEYPTSDVMLEWPTVLAPSLVVPNDLLLNIFAAIAARRSRQVGAFKRY